MPFPNPDSNRMPAQPTLPPEAARFACVLLPSEQCEIATLDERHFNALHFARLRGAFHTGWTYDPFQCAHFMILWDGRRYAAEVHAYGHYADQQAFVEAALFMLAGTNDPHEALGRYALAHRLTGDSAQVWRHVMQRLGLSDLSLPVPSEHARAESPSLGEDAHPETHADALELALDAATSEAQMQMHARWENLLKVLAFPAASLMNLN